ncbi:DUF2510 domain-containing protein [Nocardioides sp. HDW12B]|uniref:thermonuclease family protein n=1 Tax=Nocardioides sp. HDW12B TaxID=2714939 RepID=UPI00140E622F|nr:DUF2510 domain-containing protein [Nocardioides sp. HDW12B]QIK68546.1 DUF2510 domain-containing protein [Nocardioides sp. HDW12B]
MNHKPGWYQDTEQPPGHLRYFDGHRWTDYRVAAPPGALSLEHASPTSAWVGRHKVLTTVIVLLALALVGSWLPSEDGPTSSTLSATAADAEPEQEPVDADQEPDDRSATGSPPGATTRSSTAGGDRGDRAPGPVPGKKPRAERSAKPPVPRQPTFYVSRIIDGDTIELGNGETVRLVGIDTPEVGECGFEAAAANLSNLVLGEMVSLGESDEDRDSYGRLLRYVDLGDMDAGLRLIKNGRAIAAYDSRDGYGFHPRETVYVANDRGARNLCPMQTGQQAPPPAPPSPKPQPLMGGSGGSANGSCTAGYSPCLPRVADLNCDDVDGPIRSTGSDPYGLDADGDGIGCDS